MRCYFKDFLFHVWYNVHISKVINLFARSLNEIVDLDPLDDLDDILVVELMILADLLRLVLDGGAPHEGVLHLLDNRSMHFVTKVLNLNKRLNQISHGNDILGILQVRLQIS